MKRALSFGFALALIAGSIAACTMDFNVFEPGTGGTGGTGGCDCPAPTDPCKVATCVANVCGEEDRPNGEAIDMQTEGDCQSAVCQDGAVENVEDADDTLDDGNDCTADECVLGMPQSSPTAAGSACTTNGGTVCDGTGECVECLMDSDCPANAPTCNTDVFQCIPGSCMDGDTNGQETDQDCGGPDCAPCPDGDMCMVDDDCLSGVCGGNDTCSAPTCSDGVKNGDEGDVDCGANCPNQCGPGEGCNENADCVGDACTGMNGTCVPNCSDGVTNNNETDVDCGGGTCPGCGKGEMCAGVDANCLSNVCGAGDLCEASPDGTMCMDAADCQSDNCVDGFCCATACGGTCESCGIAGSEGTCTDIAAGQDPGNECMGGSCDGSGACKKDDGQACVASGECISGHFCVDNVCCATACGGTCAACDLPGTEGTCTMVPNGTDPGNECMGVCNGAGACVLGMDGAQCGAPNDCMSNFCVDGVCCADGCPGTCKACNVAGSAGTCTNIPDNTDPDNECSGMKLCNGMGVCQ